MGLACHRYCRGSRRRLGGRAIAARICFSVLFLVVFAACSPQYGVATLEWDAVEGQEISGYNVYRTEKLDEPFRRTNDDLVLEPRYVDRTAVRGKTYYYRVTSVALSGLESPASETASKTID